jgi:hypothetical protein
MGAGIDRRRLLAMLAAGSAGLAVPGLLAARGDTVSLPHAEILTHLSRQADILTAGYERAPVAATAVRIREELPVARALVAEGGFPPAARTELHRVTGRLCALWACARHDLDDKPRAVVAFDEAFRHAELAGDRSLMCWVRLWQSSLARKAGDPRRAVVLAQDGAAYVPPRSAPAARAAAIQARAHAALGEKWQVHEKVGEAWRITGYLTDDQGGPGFSIDTLATATLAELSAAAYVELGSPNLADVYVQASLIELDFYGATGLQSLARFAAATAAAQRRDLDQALDVAGLALDISADRPTSVLAGRARRFVTDARATVGAAPALDEFAERVAAWGLPPLT